MNDIVLHIEPPELVCVFVLAVKKPIKIIITQELEKNKTFCKKTFLSVIIIINGKRKRQNVKKAVARIKCGNRFLYSENHAGISLCVRIFISVVYY